MFTINDNYFTLEKQILKTSSQTPNNSPNYIPIESTDDTTIDSSVNPSFDLNINPSFDLNINQSNNPSVEQSIKPSFDSHINLSINIPNQSCNIMTRSTNEAHKQISTKTSKPIIELIANILTDPTPEESYLNSKINQLEYDLSDINDKMISLERELIYIHILMDKYENQHKIILDLTEQNEILTKTLNESNNNITLLMAEIDNMKIDIAKYGQIFDNFLNLDLTDELPLINNSFDDMP